MTISLDEMTGIQALERAMPTLPMKPGRPEKSEFEYIRHGTQSLIASFNVATGRIDHASVGDTRTEADLGAHLSALIAQNAQATKIHLVMDCLNTHQSEAVVRWGNFTGQADLKTKILNLIEYFNRTMAKPFKWTYTGKPLTS